MCCELEIPVRPKIPDPLISYMFQLSHFCDEQSLCNHNYICP